jgi:hypothetical protein
MMHFASRIRVRVERSSAVLRLRYPPLAEALDLEGRKFVFVGGLHKSGTSTLHNTLRRHADISGVQHTVHREDEGQFMQTVYAPDRSFGGPGRFAFIQPKDDECDLAAKRERLLREWGGYLADANARVLVEKSPANIIRMPWLQRLFPEAVFVVIVRHPIVVALATQRWSNTSLEELLTHWWTAHRRMWGDLEQLNSALILRYEDLVGSPENVLDIVQDLLGLENALDASSLADRNCSYLSRLHEAILNRPTVGRLASVLLEDLPQFGYSASMPLVSDDIRVIRIREGTVDPVTSC